MILEVAGGGTLRIWEENGRVFFKIECELHRDGLYKVWIRGDRGEVMLGTLVPEGEKMTLCRAFSPGELSRCGCWPVRDARCAKAYSFQREKQGDGWSLEEDPGRFVNEETRKLGEWRRMLYRKNDGWLELAYPVRKDAPLPLSHLFCLAMPTRIRGEICLIWRFNQDGEPLLPTIWNDKIQ